MLEISLVGGIAFGGLAIALLLLAWIRKIRSRLAAVAARAGDGAEVVPGPGAASAAPETAGGARRPEAYPGVHSATHSGTRAEARLETRLEAVETRLAQVVAEAASGGAEERLRDMAGSLIGLIRDKNATLETALAGLDQLRARMRALERIGEVAEARALFEELGGRIDALGSAQAAQAAETEARIDPLRARIEAEEARSGQERADLVAQFTRLYDQKDAGIAALRDRLAPLEARTGLLEEARGGQEAALARIEARIESRVETRIASLDAAREAGELALAGIRADLAALGTELRAGKEAALAPVRDIADRLSGLHAQKDALAETLLARLGALEDRVAALDPRGALDRFAERLETAKAAREEAEAGLRARIGALEAPAENPFAEISERLAGLYAQKDAAVETVLARLAPLEARLGEIEARAALAAEGGALREAEARAELSDFAGRLETARSAREAVEAGLRARIDALEAAGDPFAEIAARLAEIEARKETTVETVIALLAPLETRLGEIEAGLVEHAPRAALGRLAERLDAAEARAAAAEDAAARTAEAAEQATERAAEDALGRFAERLEAIRAAHAEAEAALRDRIGVLESGAGPFAALGARLAEIELRIETRIDAALAGEDDEDSARLTEAVTDAVTGAVADGVAGRVAETVRARLTPLEARLARIEDEIGAGSAADPVAEARAAAEALIAERTTLFANRLALLEASLPIPAGVAAGAAHPPAAVSELGSEPVSVSDPAAADPDPAPDSRADPADLPPGLALWLGDAAPEDEADPEAEARRADLAAIGNMPRIVSLHRK